MGNTVSSIDDSGFPGSALLDSLNPCGNLNDTDDSPMKTHSKYFDDKMFESEYEGFGKNIDEQRDEASTLPSSQQTANRTSALFAKALVSEVTNNPETMLPKAMAQREFRLMKAQERATKASQNDDPSKAVGVPGGVGQPSVLGSIAHALTGRTDPLPSMVEVAPKVASVFPPNSMRENRATHADAVSSAYATPPGKYAITIGLALSRRSSMGHPDTITRQTAFDFNELQDREYQFVSSTGSSGWRAGGGEPGGTPVTPAGNMNTDRSYSSASHGESYKAPAADTIHIPIIEIDAGSAQAIDAIIAALARGELFIPHMSVIPEALTVDGVSPPDLVVRFGTERNDDLPPDQWPNWCLEFMHNQLYEYFQGTGARWIKRPFSITLARKVRWKTVKHMNKYFAHAERVIDAWREKGPQYLDPQLDYIAGSAAPEEVARPHGLYLFRNGAPTNYFAPNFDPPYTTNMTRNLLLNVLNKSWDKKRREWTSEPIPRLITPSIFIGAMCGCTDTTANGFMANEVTMTHSADLSALPDGNSIRSSSHNRTIPQMLLDMPKSPQTLDIPREEDEENQEEEEASPRDARVFGPPEPKYQVLVSSSAEEEETEEESVPEEEEKPVTIEEKKKSVESTDETAEQQSGAVSPTSVSSHSYKTVSDKLETFIVSHQNGELASLSVEEEDLADIDVATATHLRQSSEQTSFAGTDTTAKHDNVSTKLMNATLDRTPPPDHPTPQEKPKRKLQLVSDEDWLDDMGEPIPSPIGVDPEGTSPYDAANPQVVEQKQKVTESQAPKPSSPGSGITNPIVSDIIVDDDTALSEVISDNASPDVESMVNDEAASDDETRVESEFPAHTLSTADFVKSSVVENEKSESREDAPEIREESGAQVKRDPPSSFSDEDPENDQENSGYRMNRSEKVFTSDSSVTKKNSSVTSTSEILKNNSGLSLEYSIDSTQFGEKSAMTSLVGGHLMPVTHESHDEDLPHVDSEDSCESVPSDESLFNVGWAKAFDPSSESHYYFTLDRSKIVWDNPLGSIHTRPSIDTDSLGAV